MYKSYECRYLITGAAGYIGTMLSRKLISRGQEVTVVVRNGGCLAPEISSYLQVIEADVCDKKALERISGNYDYIIHCAAPTSSVYMISHPAEVADIIVNGTENILRLAKRCSVKSMVYLSSMEVYGQIECAEGERITEDRLGYIDLADVRSCYPLAKLMAECLCHACHQEYDVPVKIARLSQVFGRGVKAEDNRVFAQFGRSVQNNTDIILHTEGQSMGNYCDIDDAIDAILFILLYGKNAEAYNVVNEANTMRIRDMAELVATKIADGKIKVIYDIPKNNPFGYAAATGLRLSGEKLKNLGWEAKRGIEEMYRRMLGQPGL